MEKSQMKNMVVLRNLPSNLIEEAIVVFKTVKSAKEFQYIDKIENLKNEQNKKNKKNESSIINKKYKKLKWYSIIVSIAFAVALVV